VTTDKNDAEKSSTSERVPAKHAKKQIIKKEGDEDAVDVQFPAVNTKDSPRNAKKSVIKMEKATAGNSDSEKGMDTPTKPRLKRLNPAADEIEDDLTQGCAKKARVSHQVNGLH